MRRGEFKQKVVFWLGNLPIPIAQRVASADPLESVFQRPSSHGLKIQSGEGKRFSRETAIRGLIGTTMCKSRLRITKETGRATPETCLP